MDSKKIAYRMQSLGEHMSAFTLPEARSVWFSPGVVFVDMAHDLGEGLLISALLAWADSLLAATADVYRMPDGDVVWFAVDGNLPLALDHRVPVRVHGPVRFDASDFASTLLPGKREYPTLDALQTCLEAKVSQLLEEPRSC